MPSAPIANVIGPYVQECWQLEESHIQLANDEVPNKHQKKVLAEVTPAKWGEYLSQWMTEKADANDRKKRGLRVYTMEKAKCGLERMGLTEEDSDRISGILMGRTSHEIHAQLLEEEIARKQANG